MMIRMNDGCLDFNGLLEKVAELENKVAEYEERITTMNTVIESIDDEIRFLLDSDIDTSDVLANHADVLKKIEESLDTINTRNGNGRIRVNLKIDSVEQVQDANE